MMVAQACKANNFPYFQKGSRGDGLAVGEFVQEAKDELLRTNGFVWKILWSLKLGFPRP